MKLLRGLMMLVVVLWALPAPAQVNPGLIQPGQVMGNSGSGPDEPSPTSIGAVQSALPNTAVNYYVATTGNDSNTCLSSGSPCLTIQGAWNKAQLINNGSGGFQINVADGNYSQGLLAVTTWIGAGPTAIVGNCTTPTNVVVTSTSNDGTFSAEGPVSFQVSCLEVQSSVQHDLYAKWGGVIHHSNLVFGTAVEGHQTTSFHGTIIADSSYSIIGNATYHVYAHNGAIRNEGITVTCVGSLTFTTFAYAPDYGTFNYYGATYSGCGSVTAKKFDVAGGAIQGDQGLSYLPGNVSGGARDYGGYFGSTVLLSLPSGEVDGIGTTSTDAFAAINSTPATSGAAQWSPRSRWTTQTWSGSVSQEDDIVAENESGRLVFSHQVAGGGYVSFASLNPASSGVFNVNGGYEIGGSAPTNHVLCGNGAATFYIDCATLPLSILSGLATGVATFLATPTSANLAAAVTNETGTGLLVFGTSPNITTPTGIVKGDVGLGNVANVDTTNASNISTGTLATARGGVNLSAWSAYTCTATAQTPGGTPPTFTVNRQIYWQNGKTITALCDVTVTAAGTGSGAILMTLPFTGDAGHYVGSSFEYAATALSGGTFVQASGTFMSAKTAAGASYIVTGQAVVSEVTYQTP